MFYCAWRRIGRPSPIYFALCSKLLSIIIHTFHRTSYGFKLLPPFFLLSFLSHSILAVPLHPDKWSMGAGSVVGPNVGLLHAYCMHE